MAPPQEKPSLARLPLLLAIRILILGLLALPPRGQRGILCRLHGLETAADVERLDVRNQRELPHARSVFAKRQPHSSRQEA
jgi:hypothetical protein